MKQHIYNLINKIKLSLKSLNIRIQITTINLLWIWSIKRANIEFEQKIHCKLYSFFFSTKVIIYFFLLANEYCNTLTSNRKKTDDNVIACINGFSMFGVKFVCEIEINLMVNG